MVVGVPVVAGTGTGVPGQASETAPRPTKAPPRRLSPPASGEVAGLRRRKRRPAVYDMGHTPVAFFYVLLVAGRPAYGLPCQTALTRPCAGRLTRPTGVGVVPRQDRRPAVVAGPLRPLVPTPPPSGVPAMAVTPRDGIGGVAAPGRERPPRLPVALIAGPRPRPVPRRRPSVVGLALAYKEVRPPVGGRQDAKGLAPLRVRHNYNILLTQY